ncbi:MAG: shikimate kinase [Lachnospiraceae bacterium]|nr:shikimate kinase [Lachnospiraceae bacterium]
MKLVLIVGDGAVGKMTVGQELMKITNLRLFHNHMTIEPVLEIFDDFNVDVILKLRYLIFKEFAKTENYGMIYTCMWAYDSQEDWEIMNKILKIFKKVGSELYCVELTAPLDVRLKRNITENRLKNKVSKRDIAASNERLIQHTKNHRFVSEDGEVPIKNFIRIDNSNIEADVVAKMIKEKFDL